MASSARNPAASAMHSAMQTQCSTDLPVRFLFASWRLMTSSFSAIAFRSSACGAVIVSPSSVLTGVSSVSERASSRSASGTEAPVSLN